MAGTTSVIKAIHDSDLVQVLRKLDLYDRLIKEELECSICGRPLTLDNLGGVYRDSKGEVKLVCNRIECLVTAAEEVRQAKSR